MGPPKFKAEAHQHAKNIAPNRQRPLEKSYVFYGRQTHPGQYGKHNIPSTIRNEIAGLH